MTPFTEQVQHILANEESILDRFDEESGVNARVNAMMANLARNRNDE